MSAILPGWVYRIIDGLGEYEDLHPSPRDGGECLANLWELVPKEVQREAAVYMAGWRVGHEDAARAAGLSAGNILAADRDKGDAT